MSTETDKVNDLYIDNDSPDRIDTPTISLSSQSSSSNEIEKDIDGMEQGKNTREDMNRHPPLLSPSTSFDSIDAKDNTVVKKKKSKTDSTALLRRQLKEEEEIFTTEFLLEESRKYNPERSPLDMFTLASLYARSTNEALLLQAEEWLKKLLSEYHYDTLGPNYKADCCFLLAWANLRLKNYSEARKYSEKLVEINPLNTQAVILTNLIDEEYLKEGKKGFLYGALAAGAGLSFGLVGLATVGAVLVAVSAKKSKKTI